MIGVKLTRRNWKAARSERKPVQLQPPFPVRGHGGSLLERSTNGVLLHPNIDAKRASVPQVPLTRVNPLPAPVRAPRTETPCPNGDERQSRMPHSFACPSGHRQLSPELAVVRHLITRRPRACWRRSVARSTERDGRRRAALVVDVADGAVRRAPGGRLEAELQRARPALGNDLVRVAGAAPGHPER